MDGRQILTINGGSSSIKFALFPATSAGARTVHGQIERIGTPAAVLTFAESGSSSQQRPVKADTHRDAAAAVVEFLRARPGGLTVAAVAHRVVHGGLHLLDHQLITPAVVAELREVIPIDAAHLPIEIALIEAMQAALPAVPQIACFDTAFHRDLPRVAQLLPIPRRFTDAGVRRFGFHGLSYTYLLQRLAEIAGPAAAQRRIILAHLGAGASMAAVRDRKPIDTTMAFTPTAGLVMATRPGDLDPGLLVYLMRSEKLSADQMDDMINRDCGLVGISQTSPDMRDLLAARDKDSRAAEAVDLFCYQAAKTIAALCAALGGLDRLVFSAGIGEHAPPVRAAICDRLKFLGIALDSTKNTSNLEVISTAASSAIVNVIATDEELVMAQIARSMNPHS
jgi:acetate kinase